MITHRVAVRSVLLGGLLGAVVAGFTAEGCSSNNNSSNGDDGGGGGSSGSTSSSNSGGSSSSGGGRSSSSGSSNGSSGASSSGNSSGSSSGSSSSGSDAGVGGGQADADSGSCVTSPILGGDGGSIPVGDGGAQLLFGFDNITAVPTGWTTSVVDPADSGLTASLSVNTSQGHTCPGSLQLTIPFTAFGQQADMKFTYPYPAGTPFTGTQFHFWVKVATAGDAGITVGNEFLQGNGQAYTQWSIQGADAGPYTNQDFVNFYPPVAATSWQEIVIPLAGCGDSGGTNCTGTAPVSIDLNQLGANLLLKLQDAGAPTTVVLLVDDIWLE